MAALTEIQQYLTELLAPQIFSDYCPNGLQVEGHPEVKCMISGVTACQALLDEAASAQADLILVHHGYFWKGEDSCIVGVKRQRIQTLLQHGMSLLAYHLPLDAHDTFGNNVQLAKKLGLEVQDVLNTDMQPAIGLVGELRNPLSPDAFSQLLAERLQRLPQHIAGAPEQIKRVAWCTGAAQNFIQAASQHGVDAYLSGEISEPTVHLARELGVHYFAAGHHATERYGVQALGEHIAERFNIKHSFVDIPNPV